jgi:hypothetical protein
VGARCFWLCVARSNTQGVIGCLSTPKPIAWACVAIDDHGHVSTSQHCALMPGMACGKPRWCLGRQEFRQCQPANNALVQVSMINRMLAVLWPGLTKAIMVEVIKGVRPALQKQVFEKVGGKCFGGHAG